MTTQPAFAHDARGAGLTLRPAQEQLAEGREGMIHSANCGLLIHRVGKIRNGFRTEAREFARALQVQTHRALAASATVFLYEELFGQEERFHWLVHLRTPNEYAGFIRISDHDEGVREVVEADRLEGRGGGNWERMFEEGSFQETVLVPQHGIIKVENRKAFEGLFVPPACLQTSTPEHELLHTGNAGMVVQRTAQTRFHLREEARRFAHEWGDYLNRTLRGRATVLLYEETWGRQDRIHWLIHVQSLAILGELLALSRCSEEYQQLFRKESVPRHKGGGTWAGMFVDGSFQDTVLVPHSPGMGVAWP